MDATADMNDTLVGAQHHFGTWQLAESDGQTVRRVTADRCSVMEDVFETA